MLIVVHWVGGLFFVLWGRGRFHFGSVPCLFCFLLCKINMVCLFRWLGLRVITSHLQAQPRTNDCPCCPPGASLFLCHLENGTAAPQPLPRRNDEAITKIGGYWESTNARNLFFSQQPCLRHGCHPQPPA